MTLLLRISGIMDQELDSIQHDASISATVENYGKSQSHTTISSVIGDHENTEARVGTPVFTCNWAGFCDKIFTRKSDLKKHRDRHTKPYTCNEFGCNKIGFGDKATLQRHETEKHGKHDAQTYFCQVDSCPRATKGFSRKRNRDIHMKTRHNILPITGGQVTGTERRPDTYELVGDQSLGLRLNGGDDEVVMTDDVDVFAMKLKELEMEKMDLDIRRSRVDEDIEALKRAMRLVAE